jgi:predicted nucleic acid-binding Zn ribbon protein
MPLYGYKCDTCGDELEAVESIREREKLMEARSRGLTDIELCKAGMLPLCGECQAVMKPTHGAPSINFRTWGGNSYGFSSNRPPKGNRRPEVIGRGKGLGGNRGRRPPTKKDIFREP